jgi:hypothetical protein
MSIERAETWNGKALCLEEVASMATRTSTLMKWEGSVEVAMERREGRKEGRKGGRELGRFQTQGSGAVIRNDRRCDGYVLDGGWTGGLDR